MPTGFQGSETSRVEVTIYPHGNELGYFSDSTPIRLVGHSADDEDASVVRVETFKAFGGASGTFVIEVKSGLTHESEFLQRVVDDDWIDIVFTRHGRPFHVLRGLIDRVQRVRTVSNGATTTVYRIVGRDFGKVFEVTPIWFDRLTDGEINGGAMTRIANRMGDFLGGVSTVAESVLAGFLREIGGRGRANWDLPPGLASHSFGTFQGESSTHFVNNVVFYDQDFTNFPERRNALDPAEFSPYNTYVWPFAEEWSDPMLCELYCDLLATSRLQILSETPGLPRLYSPTPSYGTPDNNHDASLPIDSTTMAVILRDRPFPSFTRRLRGLEAALSIENGPWFKTIPLYEVAAQEVLHSDVGRGGDERRNAFFAAPQLLKALDGGAIDLQVPLWNPTDMKRHGFRRFDMTTRYVASNPDLLTMSTDMRRIVRDYYCLNHLFLSGTIVLGRGRPDIRIGSRFRVKHHSKPWLDETYYVESVGHSWSLQQGARTTLGVTRGWIGTDDGYISTLARVVGEYKEQFGKNAATVVTNGPVGGVIS